MIIVVTVGGLSPMTRQTANWMGLAVAGIEESSEDLRCLVFFGENLKITN